MPISDKTRSKLEKLVPRLASDQDGEVVATVRAIQRTLDAGGNDIYDLLSMGGQTVERIVYRDRPVEPEFEDEWRMQARQCYAKQDYLRGREQDFVEDMFERSRSRRFKPSEKQAAWLESIYFRLRR